MAARGPKMADGVWKGVYPEVFERSHHLLLIKFFEPPTPFMRKVNNGKKKNKLRLNWAKLSSNWNFISS